MAEDEGITLPLLSDVDNRVANAYGVMQWQVMGEPGHTFVLVGKNGKVAWIGDYGDPSHGGLMYVEPSEVIEKVNGHLGG